MVNSKKVNTVLKSMLIVAMITMLSITFSACSFFGGGVKNDKATFKKAVNATMLEMNLNLNDRAGANSSNTNTINSKYVETTDCIVGALDNPHLSYVSALLSVNRIIVALYDKILGKEDFKISDSATPFTLNIADGSMLPYSSLLFKTKAGKYEVYYYNADKVQSQTNFSLIKIIIDYNASSNTLNNFEVFNLTKEDGTRQDFYFSHVKGSKNYKLLKHDVTTYNGMFNTILTDYYALSVASYTYDFTNEYNQMQSEQ